jgi:hypothetical protein
MGRRIPEIFNTRLKCLKLKGLADHHLNPDAFIGAGGVNADHEALRHGPDAETGIPFHIGMQAPVVILDLKQF